MIINRTYARHATGLAALVLGLATLTACGNDDEPSADPTPPSTTATAPSTPPATPPTGTTPATTEPTVGAAQVLELSTPPAASARCMKPNATTLRTMEKPFRGTVTSITDGTAEFSVDLHYDDSTFSTARVSFTGSASGLSDGWIDLEEGTSYLVATSRGQVVGCGLSGPVGPSLNRLYAEAFGAA